MKLRTVAKVAAILAAVALALLVALGLSFDWLVKQVVVRSVRQQTGCPFEVETVRFRPFTGTLEVQGLTLGNPPGFGELPLVSLPEFYVAYDLEAARTNALRFREIRLNLDQVSMVVDGQGRTNFTEIAALLDKAGLGKSRPLPTNVLGGMTFTGIGRLQVSLGRVAFADLRAPAAPRSIVMGITNRTFTNVVDLAPLGPLALEVMVKTMFQLR